MKRTLRISSAVVIVFATAFVLLQTCNETPPKDNPTLANQSDVSGFREIKDTIRQEIEHYLQNVQINDPFILDNKLLSELKRYLTKSSDKPDLLVAGHLHHLLEDNVPKYRPILVQPVSGTYRMSKSDPTRYKRNNPAKLTVTVKEDTLADIMLKFDSLSNNGQLEYDLISQIFILDQESTYSDTLQNHYLPRWKVQIENYINQVQMSINSSSGTQAGIFTQDSTAAILIREYFMLSLILTILALITYTTFFKKQESTSTAAVSDSENSNDSSNTPKQDQVNNSKGINLESISFRVDQIITTLDNGISNIESKITDLPTQINFETKPKKDLGETKITSQNQESHTSPPKTNVPSPPILQSTTLFFREPTMNSPKSFSTKDQKKVATVDCIFRLEIDANGRDAKFFIMESEQAMLLAIEYYSNLQHVCSWSDYPDTSLHNKVITKSPGIARLSDDNSCWKVTTLAKIELQR